MSNRTWKSVLWFVMAATLLIGTCCPALVAAEEIGSRTAAPEQQENATRPIAETNEEQPYLAVYPVKFRDTVEMTDILCALGAPVVNQEGIRSVVGIWGNAATHRWVAAVVRALDRPTEEPILAEVARSAADIEETVGSTLFDDFDEEHDHNLPPEWLTDYEHALKEAKLAEREIVAVFSAEWCGPCQFMVKNIYPQQPVRDELQKTWVAVYVDVDQHPEIADKYGVRAYPTFVFMDAEGNEIGRGVGGSRTPEAFLEMLKTKGASQGSDLKYQLAKVGTLTGFGDWVKSVTFSPDGKQIAVGTYDFVKVYDVATKEETAEFKTRSGYANALSFTPDSKQVLVGAYQQVELWDVATAKRVERFKGHRSYVNGISFNPAGDRFATSSQDGTVRVWNLADGSEVMKLDTLEYLVQDVAWSPDGKFLATAGGDPERVTKPGPVKIWNAGSGELVYTLEPHEKAANSVSFSPDGKFLVSTSEDEKTNLYDVSTGKPLGYFNGHQRATNDAIFSPTGDYVLSASGGRARGKNSVYIWTRTEGEFLAMVEHREPINDVALSPDGRLLASASNDQTVALWDVGAVFDKIAEDAALAAEEAEPVKEPAPKNDGDANANAKTLKVGIIGLDTSHVTAFTKTLNAEEPSDPALEGLKVVAAYPHGSKDIESSASRIPKYTKEMEALGIEIVDSIPALLEKVDVVLLETNDGRLHLEQILPVLAARKRCFVDKPFAASLADVIAIFEASEKSGTPIFTSSSLRFSESAQQLRSGESEVGKVLGCDAFSPCSLEPTHPELFWYGIHGVELLYTVMGPGCETVVRSSTPETDVVVGTWSGGRIGTFRGIRDGKTGYGGTAFGEKGIQPIGKYDGYTPLVVEIATFLKGGDAPVSAEETIELHAFMEAADESKRQGGMPVSIESVLTKARAAAADKLATVEAK